MEFQIGFPSLQLALIVFIVRTVVLAQMQLSLMRLGAVHKGRPQIFLYFLPLPPSCLQPSAFQVPLPKKDVRKLGI